MTTSRTQKLNRRTMFLHRSHRPPHAHAHTHSHTSEKKTRERTHTHAPVRQKIIKEGHTRKHANEDRGRQTEKDRAKERQRDRKTLGEKLFVTKHQIDREVEIQSLHRNRIQK